LQRSGNHNQAYPGFLWTFLAFDIFEGSPPAPPLIDYATV